MKMNLKKGFSKNFKLGFTLIELLVVVAIIGILASVVLASLNTARSKGANAAVKANLANIRPQSEILYDTWGGYGVDATPTTFALGACANTADTLFADTTIWNQISAAKTAGGSFAACMASSSAWAVAVIQKGATAAQADSGWCVDSSGKSKSITVATLDQAGINAEIASNACVE